MSYIGKAPGFGIRNRYYYTATASQTLFSGADDNGQTLAYADSKYLDVYLNGVSLVAGTDYTATTLTSVVLTTGASASDILEIVAYDIFSVADTVSASNGGTFNGAVTFADGVVVSGGTGDNTLSIPDNLASAFDITESTNSYLKFVTTDSSEAIVAGKTLQTALVEPTTDDSSDLGTSSKRFQDLYLSGGAYIGGTADANFLNDYEEGTFTPAIEGSSSTGTGTYTTSTGSYTKIGDLVHFQTYIVWTAHTGTGEMRVGNLPFNAAPGSPSLSYASVSYGYWQNISHAGFPNGYIDSNVDYVVVNSTNTSGTLSPVSMDTAGNLMVSGCYKTSA